MRYTNALKQIAWPEALGVVGASALHWVVRGIDYRYSWEKSFRRVQDYVALGAALGSPMLYTQGRTQRGIAQGLFDGNLALVLEGVADAMWEPEKAFAASKKKPGGQKGQQEALEARLRRLEQTSGRGGNITIDRSRSGGGIAEIDDL